MYGRPCAAGVDPGAPAHAGTLLAVAAGTAYAAAAAVGYRSPPAGAAAAAAAAAAGGALNTGATPTRRVTSRWSLLLGVYLATLLPATTLFKHGYDNGGADRYAHLPSLALVVPAYAVGRWRCELCSELV